jgi:hypothetical protein
VAEAIGALPPAPVANKSKQIIDLMAGSSHPGQKLEVRQRHAAVGASLLSDN